MRHRFRPQHQHLLSVPRAEPARSRHTAQGRRIGRPAALTLTAAAAVLATAAVATGVMSGPAAPAMAVAGHIRPAGDVTPDNTAGHDGAGPFLGGAAGAARPSAGPASGSPASQRGTGVPAAAGAAHSGQPAAGASQPRGGRSAAAGQPSATASPSASTSQPAPPQQPITIYDSVQPASIPAGGMAATYATGRFAVPAAEMAGRPTIWIDAWGTDPGASVLDVEPGDATPAVAATWVTEKLTADPSARARIYTMLAEWPAVQSAIAALPSWMHAHVRYWIADPTGVPHMVPGASATQWSWGNSYDISTADPGF